VAFVNKSRSSALGLLGATALVATVLFGAPASAAVPLSDEEEQAIRAVLVRWDVPAEQQDALLAKVVAGEPWDVYGEGVPVSTESRVVDGCEYSIERFADGSVAAVGVEIPEEVPAGVASPMSIVGCTTSTGSGYAARTGCQVDAWIGTVFIAALNVGYTHVQGGYDYITSTGYGAQNCIYPTSCTSPVRVAYKQHENASGNAYARWQSDVTGGVLGSWNVWVQLNVGGDTAWSTNS
jgi:hypothetical protein